MAFVQTKEVGSTFEMSGNGVYFEGEAVFVQLGNQWAGHAAVPSAAAAGGTGGAVEKEVDLSSVVSEEMREGVQEGGHRVLLGMDIYKTGFGPTTTQFVQLTDKERTVIGDKCAPSCCAGEAECGVSPWYSCFANVDVTGLVRDSSGGSLSLLLRSHGVLASSCPYVEAASQEEEVIYARLTVSYASQPTHAPTYVPTPLSENPKYLDSGDLEVTIGVEWATNIAAVCTLVFAAYGAFLGNTRRKKKSKAVSLNLARAAVQMGSIGGEFVSMVFFVNRLYVADGGRWRAYAISFVVLKMVDVVYTLYFFSYVYGSKERQAQAAFTSKLDVEHLALFSKSYAGVNLAMAIDVSAVVYLPFKKSKFSRATLGFPTLRVYRECSAITIFTSVVTIAMQVPFLSSQKSTSVQNLFFYVSLALASLKFVLSAVSYATKASQAAHISDECEEDGEEEQEQGERERDGGGASEGSKGGGGDVELASIYGAGDDEVSLAQPTTNPLYLAGMADMAGRAANLAPDAGDADRLLVSEMSERLRVQEERQEASEARVLTRLRQQEERQQAEMSERLRVQEERQQAEVSERLRVQEERQQAEMSERLRVQEERQQASEASLRSRLDCLEADVKKDVSM
jgi:hypothetical protein